MIDRAMSAAITKAVDVSEKTSEKVLQVIGSSKFRIATFIYFAFQMIWMALTTPLNVPADEKYHIGYIALYAREGWSPFIKDQSDYLYLGDATHNPFFLYHYLMSIPYRIVEDLPKEYLYLRFINIGLAVLSLYVIYLICKELNLKSTVANVTLFIVSNTIMFVFIGSAINYDNMFNLLVFLSVLYTLKLWKEFSGRNFVIFCIFIVAGMMVKLSFLPVGIVLSLIVFFRYIRSPLIFFTWVKKEKITRSTILLIVTLGILLVPFLYHYVGNISEFHSYAPKCTEVKTIEECRKYPVFRRDEQLHLHKAPITLAKEQYLINWLDAMTKRTFSVFSQRSIYTPEIIGKIATAFLALALVATIRKISKKDVGLILIISFCAIYMLALFNENRNTYLKTGIPGMAVQGRYAFAALPLMYMVGIHYIDKLLNRKQFLACCYIFLILFFFLSSLPTYIHYMPTFWGEPLALRALMS